MSENYYSPFTVGRQVYDLRHGFGTVVDVNYVDVYPVKVDFVNGFKDAYTPDGKVWTEDLVPMLYTEKMIVQPLTPKA